MMNRRDFMKLSAASAVTMGAVAGMAPASFAENAGVHTDAEVQAIGGRGTPSLPRGGLLSGCFPG